MVSSIVDLLKHFEAPIAISIFLLIAGIYLFRLFLNYIRESRDPEKQVRKEILELYREVKRDSGELKKELTICIEDLSTLKQEVLVIRNLVSDVRIELENWAEYYPPNKEDIEFTKDKIDRRLHSLKLIK